ncbi:MAG: glycosyltransferase, partial [Endomicrobiaceae bacterium]
INCIKNEIEIYCEDGFWVKDFDHYYPVINEYFNEWKSLLEIKKKSIYNTIINRIYPVNIWKKTFFKKHQPLISKKNNFIFYSIAKMEYVLPFILELKKSFPNSKFIFNEINYVLLNDLGLNDIDDIIFNDKELTHILKTLKPDFIIQHFPQKDLYNKIRQISPNTKILLFQHGLADKNYTYNAKYMHQCDFYFVSNQSGEEFLKQQGINYCKNTGYIPLDYLFNTSFNIKSKMLFFKEYKLDINKKTIMYGPTWGGWWNYSSLKHWKKILNSISDEFNIIVKLHPNIFSEAKTKIDISNILSELQDYCFNRMNIAFIHDINFYPLLCLKYIDLLISDVSSIVIEALLLNKPVLTWNNHQEELFGIDKSAWEDSVVIDDKSNITNLINQLIIEEHYVGSKINLIIKENKDGRNAKKAVEMFNNYFFIKNPKKILFICHDFPPYRYAGAQLYARNLAKAINQSGLAEVEILHPVFLNHNKNVGDYEKVIYDDLVVHRIYKTPNVLDYQNVRSDLIFDFLNKFFEDNHYDLIHFHGLGQMSAVPIEVLSNKNIPMIMTLHDYWFLCDEWHLMTPDQSLCSGPDTVEKCTECLLKNHVEPIKRTELEDIALEYKNYRKTYLYEQYNKLKHLYAPSNYLKDKFDVYGLKNISVNPLGFILQKTKEKNKSDLIRFGYAGQLIRRKGINTLVEAFLKINKPNVQLNIWGKSYDESFKNELFSMISDKSNIVYHGEYKPEDLPDIFANIDITVIPSLMENYPLLVQESYMFKTPVIASDAGGIPEAVTHEVNGLIFKAGNSFDLLEKMNQIIINPSLISSFTNNIPIVKDISEDAMYYANEYNEIINHDKAISKHILIYYFKNVHIPILKPITEALKQREDIDLAIGYMHY